MEVSFILAEPATIWKTSGASNVSQRWTLKHLLPAAGYIGAAAVESRSATFKFFRLGSSLPPQKFV